MTLENHEAYVEYDPALCNVSALIAAVANLKDPTMPTTFGARIKK